MKFLERLLMLITCLLVFAAAAIQRDGRVWGHSLRPQAAAATGGAQPANTLTTEAGGLQVVNTTTLGHDVSGYGGPVPLKIYLRSGRVERIEALPNSESPAFFDRAAALLTKWNGLTVDEALALQVDGVSGATFSSRAIVENVQRGLRYAAAQPAASTSAHSVDLSPKNMAGLAVALAGLLVPLFHRGRRWRTVQLVLNVVVLGLWCGCFLSWSLFVGTMSSGVNVGLSLIPIVLLVAAFVFPLLGRPQYYCANLCPFGSLQELAGKTRRRKWKLSATTVRRLDAARRVLFAVLLVLMLTGIWAGWADYELFTAFVVQSAGVVVVVLAVVVVVLSVFVPRPYCRFVCPTGSLFKCL